MNIIAIINKIELMVPKCAPILKWNIFICEKSLKVEVLVFSYKQCHNWNSFDCNRGLQSPITIDCSIMTQLSREKPTKKVFLASAHPKIKSLLG